MYTAFFGLRESPFSIAPNPRYLYMSNQHREALAHLQYGTESTGGFVMLSGEVGAGKTTLCRLLLNQLPDDCEIAFIFNPAQTSEELFLAICEELGVKVTTEAESSLKKLQQLIYRHLLKTHAAGKGTLLIIDEAQSLSMEVLEQLRLLTNLETDEQKLLKIILLGQPELRELIAHPELKQLSQRITARFHLAPLAESDIQPYIQHRLTIAGGSGQLFDPQLCQEIYKLSNGIPRLINVLCDRTLLGAYTHNQQQIDRQMLAQAARETLGVEPSFSSPNKTRLPVYFGVFAASLALLVWLTGIPMSISPTLQTLTPTPAVSAQQTSAPISVAQQPATAISSPVPVQPPGTVDDDATRPAAQANPTVQQTAPTAITPGNTAYEVLLSLWQLPEQNISTEEPCLLARQNGLRCLSGVASLQELASLNRPAVIQLKSAEGPSSVVLSSLTDSSATVIENQQQRQLSHTTLAQLWDGSYTLIWRPPTGYINVLRTGQSSSSVSWLKTQLTVLTSAPLDPDNHRFDSDLEFWVKAFQRSRGLSQDGVAGPHTLIHLNSVTSKRVPLLQNNQG